MDECWTRTSWYQLSCDMIHRLAMYAEGIEWTSENLLRCPTGLKGESANPQARCFFVLKIFNSEQDIVTVSLQIPDGKSTRLQIKRSVEVQPGRFQKLSLKSCSAINQQEVIFQFPGLVWFIQLAVVMRGTRRGAFQLGAKPYFHISQNSSHQKKQQWVVIQHWLFKRCVHSSERLLR